MHRNNLQRHARLQSQPVAGITALTSIQRYNAHAKDLVRSTQNRINAAARGLFKRPARATPVVNNKTLPYLHTSVENMEDCSLVKMRMDRHSEQDNGSVLKGQINHLQHEKQHCEQIVGRARRKYNSIVQIRTQALQHKHQIQQVKWQLIQRKQMLKRSNERFLSEVKSRAMSSKELHKSRMSSWKGRLSTEVSAIKQASEQNYKVIAHNERQESAKKRNLAESVRKQHQRIAEQKKQIEMFRKSFSQSNRQERILKEWDRTRGYIKNNDKLCKRLLTQFDEYKRAAEQANRELEFMSNILSVKVRTRGGCTNLQDCMSSCSYYTNHTFLTKS